MKNVHLLPTDKPSRLFIDIDDNKLKICVPLGGEHMMNQHIYITSDEEIKEGNWCIDNRNVLNKIINVSTNGYVMFKNGNSIKNTNSKKIILTTDQDLIKDGVQPIDYEFLQWFVKNSSCEFVKIGLHQEPLGEVFNGKNYNTMWTDPKYQIMIPKEEPKQETIEETYLNQLIDEANKEFTLDRKLAKDVAVKYANWQAERMYSEEEVIAIVEKSRETGLTAEYLLLTNQFKKK
jgi:hypothetical protein